MIFLNFGTELINLSQVYQIDLRETGYDGKAIIIVFFYHLADTTAGGYKVSKKFQNIEDAVKALVSLGIDIRLVNPNTDNDEYYNASQVQTERINTRLEPTRHKK